MVKIKTILNKVCLCSKKKLESMQGQLFEMK